MASDPGLLRLKVALRTVLTLLLAIAVLAVVTKALHQPPTSIFLGVVIAMLSSMVVNDQSPPAQRLTMLLLPLPAAVSVTIGALLASRPIVSDVAFLVVIFLIVCVRWFGPRGLALGMVAFISYFFSIFLHASPSALPALYLALLIGTACGYLMKFVVLPQRPERILPPAIRALRGRVANVLESIADTPPGTSTTLPVNRAQRRLVKRLTALNEAALLVETQLEQIEPERFLDNSQHQALGGVIFDLELITEQVAAIWSRLTMDGVPPNGERPYIRALKALSHSLHDNVPSRGACLRNPNACRHSGIVYRTACKR